MQTLNFSTDHQNDFMTKLNRLESELSDSNMFDNKNSHLDKIRDLTLKDVDLMNLVSKNLLSISIPPDDV